MARRRRFNTAFKRQVVAEGLAGGATVAQLCRRYEYSSMSVMLTISSWSDGSKRM